MKLTLNDPFATAQQQYQSRNGNNGTVLSSSPAAGPDLRTLQLHKSSADINGLQANDGGKMALLQRLKDKYGPNYLQNPEAMQAMTDFNQFTTMQNGTQGDLNAGFANAQRTLGALFGSNYSGSSPGSNPFGLAINNPPAAAPANPTVNIGMNNSAPAPTGYGNGGGYNGGFQGGI